MIELGKRLCSECDEDNSKAFEEKHVFTQGEIS
jgi:hypothetical protein